MNLLSLVRDRIRQALRPLVTDAEPYAAMVKATQDAKHGDYQANCAMALQKVLGKKPRDIAQEIVDRIELGDFLQKPEIAGPGFINLRIADSWLAAQLPRIAVDERLGVAPAESAKTFVVDFSGPNVAKPMHVGHLRSTIIGDALVRMLRFLGHTVVGDNHLGDWGTQFGILLHGYKNFRDEVAFQKDPVRELARLYIEVRKKMKASDEEEGDDPVSLACRQETAKLHAGDAENNRLWKMFMPACMEEINHVYRRLDIHFDQVLGESFYNPMLAEVVQDLERRSIAQESQGARVVFFKESEPPAMIRKSDGAFTYTTTDLATIKYRRDTWKPAAILYVVDARQALHFQHLFEIVNRWQLGPMELEHISFGSVLGDDRKPFKTREGGVVELETLLDEAVQRAEQVYRENQDEGAETASTLTEQELREIYEVVGIGAVKYADLCQNRTSDYIFSWPKMLAMNGNTATYMQYAYVRNRGIFRKADEAVARFRTQPPAVVFTSPHERALALQLLRFEEYLTAAAAEYQPSGVTTYLWDLAKTYSGFFQNCPVLKAESPELRDSRLLLCDLTGRVLQKSLSLLGIRTVERM